MPQPYINPGNLPVATQSVYIDYLFQRIQALESRLNSMYPGNGSTFAPGGDIDLMGNDIKNVETISGLINSFLVDNIVTNANGSVAGNITAFADTTGKKVTDSGIAVANLSMSDVTTSLRSQVGPLAPAGQRDLWMPTSTPVGLSGQIYYSSDFDLLYSSGPTTGLFYSADGGATFAPCAFDVAPTALVHVGSSPNIVVAVDEDGPTWTSTDGINFSIGPEGLGVGQGASNILWDERLGIFIYTNTLFPGMPISTSPDGLTWTARPAPFTPFAFARSSNIIVAVGHFSPYAMYSVNGLVWAGTLSALAFSECVAYSPEQKVFMMIDKVTGEGHSSTDGITWDDLGAIAPPGVGSQLLWVGATVQRWYIGFQNPFNNNYSLWTTANTSAPFAPASLDGSTFAANSSGIAYSPSRASFFLGINSSPFVVYSQARPYTIKSVSDSILIQGSPPVAAKFQITDQGVIIFNTSDPTSFWEGVPTKGNLLINSPIPVGSVFRIRSTFFIPSILPGSTLAIELKANASTIADELITGPISNGIYLFDIEFVITNSALITVNSTLATSGGVPNIKLYAPTLNTTIPNIFDLIGTFNVADPSNIVRIVTSTFTISYP